MTAVPTDRRESYPRESPLKHSQKIRYRNFAVLAALDAKRMLETLLKPGTVLENEEAAIYALRQSVREMDYWTRLSRGDAEPNMAFII